MNDKIITRAWLKAQMGRAADAGEVTLPGDQMRALLQAAWDGLAEEANDGDQKQYPVGTMN